MIIPNSCQPYIKLQRTGGVDFLQSINDDYNAILPFLPGRVDDIWDIGCGIGGIDVGLYHRYANPQLYLTDYSTLDGKVYYGYNVKTAAYNDLRLTRDFLDVNGVMMEDVHFDNLNTTQRIRPLHADIVISLLSCGFHYPVSDYFDEIVERTSRNSVLILDLRKGVGQKSPIKTYFDTLATLDYKKFIRYVGVRRKVNDRKTMD